MRPTDALPHPDDWSVARVGRTVEIRRGLSWSKEQERELPRDDTVPVLRITNIQERLELADILNLSGVPAKARELKKASKGWSIIVGSNGNRNRIGNAVLQTEDTDFLFASFLIAAKPYKDRGILPAFFFRWLSAYEIQARISASSEGTTGLSNLSHDFFRKMEIAYPEEPEQRAIARILDAADAAIERTREAIAKARRLKRGFVQAFFTRGIGHSSFRPTEIGRVPASWSVIRVGEAITEAQYGLSMPMDSKGEYPILRMAAIQDGDVLLSDLKYVNLPRALAEQYLLRRGDVLFNRTNSQELVGKVGIYRHDAPTVFASYLIRLKVNSAMADNYFLGQLLASYAAQCRIKRYATPGVQQVNINATNL